MRGSLKGVLSRVDRLAARLRPSPEDLDAEIRTMSDEALCARIMELIKKAGGPDAFLAYGGLDAEQPRVMLSYLRDHWHSTGER